jgi:aspartate/methionine/tyrosine aminotransferase
MLSRRLPQDRTPNALSHVLAERRRVGARLLDLAESNPTHVGLGGAEAPELAALVHPEGARYDPAPLGLLSARTAVAAYYQARGLDIAPDRIALTASTSEAYAHLFRLLADPGDVLLVPLPSYPLFEPLAALEDVRLVPYHLRYDQGWHLDTASLESAVRGERPRGVIVVQPNNPTGSCLSPEEVQILDALCMEYGLAIISDEVFSDFPRPPTSGPLPSLLRQGNVLTFVLGGLSKSCGMPQMKLAWIAVSGEERSVHEALAGLEWIADLFLSVATPVQLALPALFAAGTRYRAAVARRLATNLDALHLFTARRPEVSLLAAGGGWSAVLRVPRTRTDEEWALECARRDVIVHPGHFYDFADDGHLVVSLLPEPVVFAEALERLEAVMAIS